MIDLELSLRVKLVKWLARTKMIIARANARNGKITCTQCDAIVQARMELAEGQSMVPR